MVKRPLDVLIKCFLMSIFLFLVFRCFWVILEVFFFFFFSLFLIIFDKNQFCGWGLNEKNQFFFGDMGVMEDMLFLCP